MFNQLKDLKNLDQTVKARPETRSGKRAGQKTKEINRLIEVMNDLKIGSYLEIGARHGDTFFKIMQEVPSIKYGLALDLPGGAWGESQSATDLYEAADELNRTTPGMPRAHVLLGSSQDSILQQTIKAVAPFDAILIDGDHRYDGVKADYDFYAPLAAKLVVFHDIAGEGVRQKSNPELLVEVPRLWKEIIGNINPVFYEEVVSDQEPENPMGIGILSVQRGMDDEIT